MSHEANQIVVRAATIWEIAIKRTIGKLRFDRPIAATGWAWVSRSCPWWKPTPSMRQLAATRMQPHGAKLLDLG